VTDNDLEPNAGPFRYELIPSGQADPVESSFTIDRKGVIRTSTHKFDPSLTTVYNLTVRVTDNGVPPLHTDVTVSVTIIEERRSPPDVTPLAVVVTAIDDNFPGGVVGRVRVSFLSFLVFLLWGGGGFPHDKRVKHL